MKVKILGTRGEIEPSAPYHSRHSGALIDKNILFDLGEKKFLIYHPNAIFITHLHPDHAFFIRDPKKEININIPMYAPESYKNQVEVKKISKSKRLDGYKITPIPTHHSLKVKSQAYLIQKDDQKILYTGDMIWIDKKYHHLLKNMNLVITEASYLRKGGLIRKDKDTEKIYGHTGIPDLMRLFSKFCKNIILIHFGSWFYEDIKEAREKIGTLSKEYDINVIVGYDGLEIGLEDLEED